VASQRPLVIKSELPATKPNAIPKTNSSYVLPAQSPTRTDERPSWESYKYYSESYIVLIFIISTHNQRLTSSTTPQGPLTEYLKVTRCAACLQPLGDIPASVYYGNAYHETCLRFFIAQLTYPQMIPASMASEPVDAYRVHSEDIVEVSEYESVQL
jgi:hypothetical protein